jgi:pimeloyl-ACP methyl ester carboxylesterase
VALQIAVRHPGLVRKLVFASSMTRRDGARPEFWDFMARVEFAACRSRSRTRSSG